jgi:hypothetical protein
MTQKCAYLEDDEEEEDDQARFKSESSSEQHVKHKQEMLAEPPE